MDINAALARARELNAQFTRMLADPEASPQEILGIADQFTITWEAIDGWLSRGGFLPAAWRER